MVLPTRQRPGQYGHTWARAGWGGVRGVASHGVAGRSALPCRRRSPVRRMDWLRPLVGDQPFSAGAMGSACACRPQGCVPHMVLA